MRVNGNITLGESGKIENLTLSSGTAFPDNGNLGEKFFLSTGIDADTPKGEYEHDGTAWQHIPTLAETKALIINKLSPKTDKVIGVAEVQHNLSPIGTNVFTNRAVARIANGLPVDKPLPGIWIDPADYPAGTKLRFHLHISVNNTTSSTTTWTVGLRKFLRPAAGGAAGIVIYSLDTPILGAIVVASPQTALAERDFDSVEFDMPATAGLYGFAYTQSGANAAGSVHHMTATLTAFY